MNPGKLNELLGNVFIDENELLYYLAIVREDKYVYTSEGNNLSGRVYHYLINKRGEMFYNNGGYYAILQKEKNQNRISRNTLIWTVIGAILVMITIILQIFCKH